MANHKSVLQPPQKLSYSRKTKKWRINNIEYADNYSFYNNERVRSSLRNKVINLNLYNGIVDPRDMNKVLNPNNQQASFIPKEIPHHPIMISKINLLVGEEMKRIFEPKILVSNNDAISEKQEELKRILTESLVEYYEARLPEEEFEAKLNELEDYLKYSWKDIREKMVNQLYSHFSKKQNFKSIFNNCFKNSLLFGEEICQIEIINGEPLLTILNPLKVHTIRSGNSDKIEDSQMIIIEDHWSPGKIIDYFHEDLKSTDIDHIQDYNSKTVSRASTEGYSDDYNHTLLRDALNSMGEPFLDSVMDYAEINGHTFSADLTDESGNIRVFRVYWRSLKKIKKVKYYDEYGDVQYKIRSEEYIDNKALGEESETLWVNEWWEGTKIGKDIYINMRPMEIQYNVPGSTSYGHPGIIGQIYSTNQGKAVSLVDRMKNYQYMYDVMWDRLNKAIATNYGKIFELDLAKIPENWEIEKWLHYAITNKIAVVDSFKEGNKGAATGKLAGGFNTQGGRSIDMETGNYIQQHIQMLEFIKNEIGEIAGVTKQREGQISNRETVGGVERSVNQSANITEYWFSIHEDFKIRVIRAFIEAAKIALRDNKEKAQYILDDMTIQILEIDGEMLAEADYDVLITNSSKASELEQNINELSQAFLQNGGRLSTVMDVFMSDSLADKRMKIKIAEDEMDERAQEENEIQERMNSETIQAQAESEQAERDLKDLINQRDNETKIYLKELELAQKEEESADGIVTSELSKIENENRNKEEDRLLKIKELNDKMKMHRDKMKLESRKISKMNKN